MALPACDDLLDRQLEWDVLPVVRNEGLGLMCWSPLGGGLLTGIVRRGMIGPPAGSRIDLAQKGGRSESWTNYDTEHTWRVLDEFAEAVRECESSHLPVQPWDVLITTTGRPSS